ncbi:AAA family ATPase [Gordonia sp. NPDC003950]
MAWRDLGASPIPVRLRGQKEPDVTTWSEYQVEQPSSQQIEEWFGPKRGIGIVTGIGGIELLEFENEVAWTQWCRAMADAGHAEDLRKICDGYLAQSGGGGYHLIYRTDEPSGNVKLARTASGQSCARYVEWSGEHDFTVKTSDVLIETRGVGGYVVVAGGDADVHPTGQPYRRIRLPEHYVHPFPKLRIVDLDDHQGSGRIVSADTADDRAALSPAPDHLHHVDAELRDVMFSLARQQNQREPRAQKGERRSPLSRPNGQGMPGARPGDAWMAVTTWDEILEPHGWRRDHSTAESDRWTRPGKASGTSATTNFAGTGLLYVFSSSTVFETGDEQAYSKFGAYAQLNFDGDMEAAARDLVEKGFADPLRAEADTWEQRVVQLAVEAEMRMEAQELARRNRAARDWRLPTTRSGLTAITDPAVEPPHLVEGLVIGEGVTLLSAQNKAGKSTVGVNVVKAVLYEQPLFGKLATHLPSESAVGIWNAEVGTATYEKWCLEAGLFADEANAARVHFYHCVGDGVDIQSPQWREWAVGWLRENNIKLWLLDPLSKIMQGNEDKADDVNAFWRALREIMKEAACPAAFVIHHAGHVVEGMRARARGSSAIEGDPEVILSYEHNGKPGDFPPDDRRYLSGVGRIDVVDKLNLDYDHPTRALRVSGDSAGKVGDQQVRLDREVARTAYRLLGDLAREGKDEFLSQVALKKAVPGNDRAIEAAITRCHARVACPP